MNIVDYILIALLLIFFFKGYRVGIIGSLGWLIGFLVGVWAAGHYVSTVSVWLQQYLHNPSLSVVIAFGGTVLVVSLIVGLFFSLLNKVINFVPFVGLVNRLLGGVLGIIEGALLIGIVLWFILILPMNNSYTEAIKQSALHDDLINASGWIRHLLPTWMTTTQMLDFARFGLPNPGQFSPDDFLKRLSPEQLELIKNELNKK